MLDIRQIAVGRLLLDNFSHIKAYWQMMTPKIAQIALRFGADDLDGTVIEEKIYHDAGATTPQGMRRTELMRLIKEAGVCRWNGTPCTAQCRAMRAVFTVAVRRWLDPAARSRGQQMLNPVADKFKLREKSSPIKAMYSPCALLYPRLGRVVP